MVWLLQLHKQLYKIIIYNQGGVSVRGNLQNHFRPRPNPKFLIKSKNNDNISNSSTDCNDMGEGRGLGGTPFNVNRGSHEAGRGARATPSSPNGP